MTNQQTPAPAGEYPPLPEPDATTVGLGAVWNRHSMRAYVDADRAMRTQAAPEDIRSILVRCREFIDTTKIPAYPTGADLADEIDALLAAQAAPAAVATQSWNRYCAAGICLETDGVHNACCQRNATQQPTKPAPAAIAGPSQWACKTCGCEYGVAGEPYWTHDRTPHPVEAIWRCDKCDATHEIKLVEPTQAAPAAQEDALDAAFEAVRHRLCGMQRYSFVLDDDGVVRRVEDRTGRWIEFDDAHELFDPVAVDAARSQAKEGGA